MKYAAALAMTVGAAIAQEGSDIQKELLLRMGLPECSLDCIVQGMNAAVQAGCPLQDVACSCPGGQGFDASTSTVLHCLTTTAACPPNIVAELQPAMDRICGSASQDAAAVASSSTTSATPTSTPTQTAASGESGSAGALQQVLAARVVGIAGIAAAVFV